MSAVCFAIIHIVDDNVECFTTNLRINLKIWVNYINMNFINMVRVQTIMINISLNGIFVRYNKKR